MHLCTSCSSVISYNRVDTTQNGHGTKEQKLQCCKQSLICCCILSKYRTTVLQYRSMTKVKHVTYSTAAVLRYSSIPYSDMCVYGPGRRPGTYCLLFCGKPRRRYRRSQKIPRPLDRFSKHDCSTALEPCRRESFPKTYLLMRAPSLVSSY